MPYSSLQRRVASTEWPFSRCTSQLAVRRSPAQMNTSAALPQTPKTTQPSKRSTSTTSAPQPVRKPPNIPERGRPAPLRPETNPTRARDEGALPRPYPPILIPAWPTRSGSPTLNLAKLHQSVRPLYVVGVCSCAQRPPPSSGADHGRLPRTGHQEPQACGWWLWWCIRSGPYPEGI